MIHTKTFDTCEDVTVFDTLKFTKRAMSAGFTATQAEFQADELSVLLDSSLVSRDFLKQELISLEKRIQLFHYKLFWMLLGGAATTLTLSQALFHFFK